MLIMFHKHGKGAALSDKEKSKIASKFMLVFTDTEEIGDINQERLEQHQEQL